MQNPERKIIRLLKWFKEETKKVNNIFFKKLRIAEKIPQTGLFFEAGRGLRLALLSLIIGLSSASLAMANPGRAGGFDAPDQTESRYAAWLSENEAEARYMDIIIDAADQYGVDPALITAIIKAESQFNPRAVSHRGARGLMQLMPGTARAMGVKNSFDPEHNIQGGTKYMKQLLNEFDGKIKLALAAYNAGSRNVRKYQGVPPYKVTRNYIRKVFLYYETYKDIMGGYPNRS